MISDDEQGGDFCWGDLAARLLHPVQVEIIEALRRIGLPLTAADFVHVLEGKRTGLQIEHHLRRLRRLDAVRLDEADRTGVPTASRSYRLVRLPGCDSAEP